MPNPLFDTLGRANNMPQGLQNMMQAFKQFKEGFRGNPQQIVQEMLNSGRMSQDQYNKLVQMAQQLAQYFQ